MSLTQLVENFCVTLNVSHGSSDHHFCKSAIMVINVSSPQMFKLDILKTQDPKQDASKSVSEMRYTVYGPGLKVAFKKMSNLIN